MSLKKGIIIDFINGDDAATGLVFNEYKNLLYFLIASIVDNQEDCADLLQETFLKAMEHKYELKDPTKIKTYLCSIAKNEALSFLKKKKEVLIEDIENYYPSYDNNDIYLTLEPLLEPKETLIVYLKAVFSYSWEEILSETGIPISTARLIYKNAKEKLKKELR